MLFSSSEIISHYFTSAHKCMWTAKPYYYQSFLCSCNKRKEVTSTLSPCAPIPPRSVHAQCFLCWRDTWPSASNSVQVNQAFMTQSVAPVRSSPDSSRSNEIKQLNDFVVFCAEIKLVDGDVSEGQMLLSQWATRRSVFGAGFRHWGLDQTDVRCVLGYLK